MLSTEERSAASLILRVLKSDADEAYVSYKTGEHKLEAAERLFAHALGFLLESQRESAKALRVREATQQRLMATLLAVEGGDRAALAAFDIGMVARSQALLAEDITRNFASSNNPAPSIDRISTFGGTLPDYTSTISAARAPFASMVDALRRSFAQPDQDAVTSYSTASSKRVRLNRSRQPRPVVDLTDATDEPPLWFSLLFTFLLVLGFYYYPDFFMAICYILYGGAYFCFYICYHLFSACCRYLCPTC